MGAKAFLTAKPRNQVGGRLTAHNLGRNRPRSAVGGLEGRENTVLVNDVRGVAGYVGGLLGARKRRRQRGSRPRPCVEVVIDGPPHFGADGEWPRELVDAYLHDSLDWLRDWLGPEARVSVAAIHRDEARPHLHVMFVPAFRGEARVELGWCALQAERFPVEERPLDEKGDPVTRRVRCS